MTAATLAVDGGNSKTDVALVAADGTVLGFARGGGSCYQTVGAVRALDVLGELVRDVAAQAGLDAAGAVAQHGAFYLAGADLPEEVQMLHARVAAAGWCDHVVVDNDTFALLRAGSDAPDRVAVVCGAGINCVGVSERGDVARFPALGRISGDWGGGTHLGGEALWLAVRAEDRRGEPTALRDAVRRHFDKSTVADVSAAIHLGELPVDRLHELVPLLFAVARQGDRVARSVVDRLAEEIAILAMVALERLDLLDRPADVVLGGAVLAARHPMLLDAIGARIGARAHQAALRVVDEPPVVGAALLGLDAVGAGATARERLRDELRAVHGRAGGG